MINLQFNTNNYHLNQLLSKNQIKKKIYIVIREILLYIIRKQETNIPPITIFVRHII